MNRLVGLSVFCLTLIGMTGVRADDDPIREKLDQARTAYDSEIEKYRAAVTAFMDAREEAARRDPNKRLVDQIKAERQAFGEKGEVPKTLPSATKSELVTARITLESAYKTAVKEYTRTKQDEKASVVEKELADFSKVEAVVVEVPPGPFQAKSVWVSDNPTRTFTVLERKGDAFRATCLIEDKQRPA